jgi:hypothetical protein
LTWREKSLTNAQLSSTLRLFNHFSFFAQCARVQQQLIRHTREDFRSRARARRRDSDQLVRSRFGRAPEELRVEAAA